jgi:hypothetical protein
MKRLSLWARHHKWSARLLIVACYVVLNTAGFLIGDLLLLMGITVSSYLIYRAVLAALAAFALYPHRKEKHRYPDYYLRQKACDAVLITTTFLLVIGAVNGRHSTTTPFQLIQAGAIVPSTANSSRTLGTEKPVKKTTIFKKIGTTLTHAFQKVRNYYKRLDTSHKILLTTLVALLAIAALYGVVAWACSLSCSGPEAVGWIVLVGGTGVVLFLMLWAARAINRAYRRHKDRNVQPTAG